MRSDETVICLGQDIGAFGGAFKVTDGFYEEFGASRVIDAPLAENAIIGAAVGAAAEGLKPVCEMQFADFIACGFDQLVNVAAKLHYRQGVAVPMVVRLPSGGGFSGGPFHSQNPEAWLLQTPGLKVVTPATAADAKGLLTSAIRDPNPVCFLEHKGLYRNVRDEVPAGDFAVPIGKAHVAREGTEASVIAYGSSVPLALRAAEELSEDVEVARPANPLPARHRGDPGERPQDLQGPRRPRGDALVRGGSRGLGPDLRGGVRGPRRADQAPDRAGRADSVQPPARAGGPAAARRHEGGSR